MRYIERNLRQNEQVIARAHVTYWALVPIILRALLICGVIAGALYAAGRFVPDYTDPYTKEAANYISSNFTLFLIVIAVVALIIIIIPLLKLFCIQLVVTDKKLTGKYGVIYVHSLDTYLEKIDNFTIEETILGRIFRYNTITVGTTSSTLKFRYIAKAKQFKNAVMDCYDARLESLMDRQAELIQQACMPEDNSLSDGYPDGGNIGIGPDDSFGGIGASIVPEEVSDIVSDEEMTSAVSEEEVPADVSEEVPDIPDIEDDSDAVYEEETEADAEPYEDAEELPDSDDFVPEDTTVIEEDVSDAPLDFDDVFADQPAADDNAPVQDPLYFSEYTENVRDDSGRPEGAPDFEIPDLDDILNFREVNDDFGFDDPDEEEDK